MMGLESSRKFLRVYLELRNRASLSAKSYDGIRCGALAPARCSQAGRPLFPAGVSDAVLHARIESGRLSGIAPNRDILRASRRKNPRGQQGIANARRCMDRTVPFIRGNGNRVPILPRKDSVEGEPR
jgi:hypothetical protein